MFAKRREILEPLSHEIVRVLESVGGPSSTPTPLSARTAVPAGTIPVEEVHCERCGAVVALLVFAEGATDRGQFEDVARMMYPHYAASTAQTYITGAYLHRDLPLSTGTNDRQNAPAVSLLRIDSKTNLVIQ